MANGIIFAAGIFEGNVAEFNFIVVVHTLFNGKRALIHLVGNIEKAKCEL